MKCTISFPFPVNRLLVLGRLNELMKKWILQVSIDKVSIIPLKPSSQYNVCIALRPEVNVNEYVDAGIEPSSIPASTSASLFVYIDFRSQRNAKVIL